MRRRDYEIDLSPYRDFTFVRFLQKCITILYFDPSRIFSDGYFWELGCKKGTRSQCRMSLHVSD